MKLEYDGTKLCFDGTKLCLCGSVEFCECTNCEPGTCMPDMLELTISGILYDDGEGADINDDINRTVALSRAEPCIWSSALFTETNPTEPAIEYRWFYLFSVFGYAGGFTEPIWEYHGSIGNGIYFRVLVRITQAISQVGGGENVVTEDAMFQELMGPLPTLDCLGNIPEDVTYYGAVRSTFSPALSDSQFISGSPVATIALP